MLSETNKISETNARIRNSHKHFTLILTRLLAHAYAHSHTYTHTCTHARTTEKLSSSRRIDVALRYLDLYEQYTPGVEQSDDATVEEAAAAMAASAEFNTGVDAAVTVDDGGNADVTGGDGDGGRADGVGATDGNGAAAAADGGGGDSDGKAVITTTATPAALPSKKKGRKALKRMRRAEIRKRIKSENGGRAVQRDKVSTEHYKAIKPHLCKILHQAYTVHPALRMYVVRV
jgi:hypothetical protein